MSCILQFARMLALRLAALFLGTVGMSGLVIGLSNSALRVPCDEIAHSATGEVKTEPARWLLTPTGAVNSAIDQAAVVQVSAVAIPPFLDLADAPLSSEGAPGFSARLSQDGLVPGRFTFVDSATGNRVAAKRLTISFLQNGKIIAQVRPGVEGIFQAPGLVPGIYSLVASGPDGFLAAAILVQPVVKGQVTPAEQALQIDASLISAQDASFVRILIRDRLPADRQAMPGAGADYAAAVPAEIVSQRCLTPRLIIGPDGHLRGRMRLFDSQTEQHRLIPNGTAFLIRQKKIVAKADVYQDGVFDIDAARWNLAPGEFSLLITGSPRREDDLPAGTPTSGQSSHFAALGVTVIRAEDLSQPKAGIQSATPYRLVSAIRVVADNGFDGITDLWGGLVPAQDIQAASSAESQGGGTPGEGIADGGGGGGAGIGGGQGGVLGGALVGGAIVGGAAGALSASKHSDNIIPASPATTR